jgi:hypothetical protein
VGTDLGDPAFVNYDDSVRAAHEGP